MRKSLSDKTADEIISDYLTTKQIGSGERMPTMRDLRKRYSVSVSTISHALELLVQRGVIEKRPNGTCYVADSVQSDTQSRTKLIGYVMSIMDHPTSLTLRVYKGIDAVCQMNGYHLLTADSGFSYEKEQQHVTRLLEASCEGIIVFPVARTREQLKNDYLKTEFKNTPIVLVDIAYPEQKRSAVVFDNYKAGFDMTSALIERGHRKIATMDISVIGNHMQRSTMDRVRGYVDAFRVAGIAHRPEDIWPFGLSWGDDLAARMLRWRNEKDRATALVALEDNAAMQAISSVREMGLSVPEDLQVTGFDNWRTAESFSPLFPTTMPNFERAGEIAASTLFEHINGGLLDPINYVLPVPVLWRSTPDLGSDEPQEVENFVEVCHGD